MVITSIVLLIGGFKDLNKEGFPLDKRLVYQTYEKTFLCMGTVVHIKIVTSKTEGECRDSFEKSKAAFYYIDNVCNRFDDQSEVRRMIHHVGEPVQVSDALFEAIRFAWEVAEITGGLFDPTIGQTLEALGFNQHYLTGMTHPSSFSESRGVSYKDICLDPIHRTVMIQKPLIIDLGAVAKGMAVDLAAKELKQFEGFYINAGGDIFVRGLNEYHDLWTVGIRHPVKTNQLMGIIRATDIAICTSGHYERKSPILPNTYHIVNPFTKQSPDGILSCTAIGPFAMMADVFSTAAYLLGEKKGIKLLEDVGLEGCLMTSSLTTYKTKNLKRYHYEELIQ